MASSAAPVRRLARVASHLASSSFGPRRRLSSAPSASDDVLFSELKNGNVLITLNRPKALNALDLSMVEKLTPRYEAWTEDAKASRILVMKGEGGKAFCAGGDIKAVYDAKRSGKSPRECCGFFASEYVLNQLIGTLPSHLTQVAILNGITMGGGVGLSVHGQYRVATDNTLFAMPETAIGFFCDVGGSFFLPRLARNLGMYLALTGARLKGPEVTVAGVATHFVPSGDIEALEKELLEMDPLNADVEAVLGRFATKMEDLKAMPEDSQGLSESRLQAIDRCFGHSSVEAIIGALEKEDTDWASLNLKLLSKMSPTSLKVVHQQMSEGLARDFKQCFEMELIMTERFMEREDFCEGVRALLIDKDKSPKWNPPSLKEVTGPMVEAFFK